MVKRRASGEGEARTRTTIYRRINPRVHGSEDFLALSSAPSGRALWLFLLSCREMTRIPGVILAGPMALAESIEWEPSDFERCLGEVLGRGMARMDRRARVLWLTHAHLQDENRPENPNQILGWRTTWDLIPECDLKVEIWTALRDWMHTGDFAESMQEAFDEACPEPRRNRSPNGCGNGSRNGSRNQDQDTGSRTGTGDRRERSRAHTDEPPLVSDVSPTPSAETSPEALSAPPEASALPTPAPEVDRAASAKPGTLPRAVATEDDDRLRAAYARAEARPPPPDDMLDETTGPTLAIDAYNASRHPSLPEASPRDTGLRAAVWATVRNARAEARAARERGEPEPEHPMHRLAGWTELGERTHGALYLHPRRDGPCMQPTPTLLFFTKGRDGSAGTQNRSALYAKTWDKIRSEQARKETAAERQIREGLERVEAARAEALAIDVSPTTKPKGLSSTPPGWMGLLEAGQRAAGGER